MEASNQKLKRNTNRLTVAKQVPDGCCLLARSLEAWRWRGSANGRWQGERRVRACVRAPLATGNGKGGAQSHAPHVRRQSSPSTGSSLPRWWRGRGGDAEALPSVRASWPSRPSIPPHVSPPRGHRANHITPSTPPHASHA